MSSTQFLMVNPLYDMSGSFTDASTNIDYQANASRNFINLIGDISNVDVSNTLYEGKTYDPSLSLVQFVKKTKKNFLDSNTNTTLDNLLYWARNTSGQNKFPILETGASGESSQEQTIQPRFTPVYTNITGVTNEHKQFLAADNNNFGSWNGWNPAENWSMSFKLIKETKWFNNYFGYRTVTNDGAIMNWGEHDINGILYNALIWNNDNGTRMYVNVSNAYGDYTISSTNPRHVQVLITYSNSNYTQNGGGTNPDFGQDLKWYARYADSENNLNNATWTDVTTYSYSVDDALNENSPMTWVSNNPELWLGSRDAQGGFKSSNPGSIYDFKMWNDTLTTDDL